MRRLRFALCALSLLVSLAAHADSISVFQITSARLLIPGEDSDGFMAFDFTGPRISISGQGSFDCPSGWCIDHFVAEGTPIDFGNFVPAPCCTEITIRGKTYRGAQAALNTWTMNPDGALFVPDSDGQAVLNGNGLMSGSINTGNGTFLFEIKVPKGNLELSWVQSVENPSNYTLFASGFFARSSPVPEPDGVVLVGTGLVGILSTARFRHRRSQQTKKQP